MRSLSLALFLTATLASAQSTTTNVQLILDASGSMFSRFADTTRIAAAKDVLTNFVSSLPEGANLNVGLRIYGANTSAGDPSACQDSKLVLPMRGLDRAALTSTVTATRPRGATPIVYSLTQAAADFPQDASRKLVVLVTDGLESCGGNLQAALEAFKARGIEVDIRVIGIDLGANAQRAFSGLKFENVDSSAALAAALGRATQDVAKPVETRLPVTVDLTENGRPVTSGATVSFVGSVDASNKTDLAAGTNGYTGSLLAGTYTATVTSAANGAQSFSGLTVAPGAANRFTFEIGKVANVNVTVTPANPVAGSKVQVAFSGAPAGDRNWVTVTRKGDPDAVYSDWTYAKGASGNVELTLPDVEGELEARYVLKNPDGTERVIGRSVPFTARRVTTSVDGPSEALAGGTVSVRWTGPNNERDYVTIVKKGAPEGSYLSYQYTRSANPVTLNLPTEPGEYELRYSSDDSNKTMASKAITLKAAEYALDAPSEALAGGTVSVRWTGPNNARDYVTIVKKGAPAGSYLSYGYTRNANPVQLKLPVEPGEYELRYSTEASSPNPILASRPITLKGSSYALEAPSEAVAGGTVDVRWTGPNNERDYITIVKKGAPVGSYLDYGYTRNANPVRLKLPVEPGEYELRYSTEAASPNPTLASRSITLKGATYNLSGPREAKVGETISVRWTGPGNAGDYITIVKKGAPVGSYLDYAYTREGATVQITVPNEPGEYELRYSTEAASPNPTLFSAPITVKR
ncbi:VWA domain-containing protein [Deinococcus yavapaiensis]|uniref:Ca-activated chloride channel family protein n=1 Tax=Deinococcus yavapaiensis KR-236 TaxID=694435 RepID=A0A318SQE5_9DEIO|nr:VWA domain-containing protein [Deinococcus yavapaiensis]PYE54993.1 Ca-activated chloride channel family protein [Deinococcus yavapaiensis KR-236]